MASITERKRMARFRKMLKKYQSLLNSKKGTAAQRQYWRYVVAQCEHALNGHR